MKITKTEINKLLIEERKKSRAKQKASKFMSKTLSIFNGQKSRAAKLGKEVHYTLEDFRYQAAEGLTKPCPYCKKPFTLNNLTSDHAIPISKGGEFYLVNNSICCQPCNYQKGNMTATEFAAFLTFIGTMDKDTAEDIKRRLTLGGKWAGNMYQ